MNDTNTTAPGLPTPKVWPTVENQPYWDATREHRLVLPRCTDCSTYIWYPRGFCPNCASFDIEWVDGSGRGTIYSFSIGRRGQGFYRDAAPYVLAYVELEEGPRVLTNIVTGDPDTIAVGDPVTAVFHDTEDGYALLRFEK